MQGEEVEPDCEEANATLASCGKCGGRFATNDAKCRHEARCPGKQRTGHKFECPECGRSFPKPSMLDYHWRIHSGEKPFSCAYCDLTFARRDYAVRHIRRVHDKEKETGKKEREDLEVIGQADRPVLPSL